MSALMATPVAPHPKSRQRRKPYFSGSKRIFDSRSDMKLQTPRTSSCIENFVKLRLSLAIWN
jgi:hypothetical protein